MVDAAAAAVSFVLASALLWQAQQVMRRMEKSDKQKMKNVNCPVSVFIHIHLYVVCVCVYFEHAASACSFFYFFFFFFHYSASFDPNYQLRVETKKREMIYGELSFFFVVVVVVFVFVVRTNLFSLFSLAPCALNYFIHKTSILMSISISLVHSIRTKPRPLLCRPFLSNNIEYIEATT